MSNTDLSNMVIRGTADWLFLKNDSNNVLDQHIGNIKLTKSEINDWLKVFQSQNDYCKENNIKLCTLFVPNSHTIMCSNLPEYKLSNDRIINQITRTLYKNNISVLCPTKILSDEKAKYPTYIKNDTHWSDYGAFLVAQEVLKHLGIKNTELSHEFIKVPFLGDLGGKVCPKMYSSTVIIKYKEKLYKEIYDNKIHNIGRRIINKIDTLAKPKCLIFGNSFIEKGFLKIISNYFSETHFIFDCVWDYYLIDQLKPDIIISQYLERFLVQVPNENKELKARSRAAIKLFSKNIKSKSFIETGIELNLSETYLYKAIEELKTHNKTDAIFFFEKAVILEMNPEFYYIFGCILIKYEAYGYAEKYFRICTEMDKTNLNYLSKYIHSLYLNKKYKLSKYYYSQLTKL